MERKARTDPKASPERQPRRTERRGDAGLRYIADDNSFSLVRMDVFENLLR